MSLGITNKISPSNISIAFNDNATSKYTVAVDLTINQFKIIKNIPGESIFICDDTGNIGIQPLDTKEFVINDAGNDVDVRIEGSSNAQVFFC